MKNDEKKYVRRIEKMQNTHEITKNKTERERLRFNQHIWVYKQCVYSCSITLAIMNLQSTFLLVVWFSINIISHGSSITYKLVTCL